MDKVNGNWLDPSNINYISENYSNNLRTQNAFDNHIIEDGWNKDSDGKYRKNVYTTDNRFLDFNDTFKILNPLIDSTTFLANSIKDSKENKEFNRKRNASTFNYNYNPNEEGINNIPVYYQNGGDNNPLSEYIPKLKTPFDDYLSKPKDEFIGEIFLDPNNLPDGYNNPGNLRPPGKTKGFRSFKTPQEGYNALVDQVELYKSGNSTTGITGESTLFELINKYAPKKDNNNPKLYTKFIADNLGISPNTPISQIDTNKLVDLIINFENNPSYKRNINRKQNGGWLDETIGDYKWLDNINDTGYLSGSDTEQNRYNIIPSKVITMKGVDYPIYGVDDLGNEKIMFPENDYLFEGNFVYEKPIN